MTKKRTTEQILTKRARNHITNTRRRAKKLNAEIHYSADDIKNLVYRNDECFYCHKEIDAKTFSIDHMVPISQGGSFYYDNLAVTCQTCNAAKGDLTSNQFQSLITMLDIFGQEVRKRFLARLKAGGVIMSRRMSSTHKA